MFSVALLSTFHVDLHIVGPTRGGRLSNYERFSFGATLLTFRVHLGAVWGAAVTNTRDFVLEALSLTFRAGQRMVRPARGPALSPTGDCLWRYVIDIPHRPTLSRDDARGHFNKPRAIASGALLLTFRASPRILRAVPGATLAATRDFP